MRVVAILLAAGSSRRFGSEKLLADCRGRPLIEHALDALLDARGVDSVVLVVRPGFVSPARERCTVVINEQHAEGLGASLRAGVAAAPPADALLVALADMPDVSPALIEALIAGLAASARSIVVPVHRGRRGHPVAFRAALRGELLALKGDVGARTILAAHPEQVEEMATDDPAVVRDVDEPADLGARG